MMILPSPEKPWAPYYEFVHVDVLPALRAMLKDRADDPASLRMCAYLLRTEHAKGDAPNHIRVRYEVVNECRGLAETTTGTGEWLEQLCAHLGAPPPTPWEKPREGHKGQVRRVDVSFLERVEGPPRAGSRDAYVHVVTGRPIKEHTLIPYLPGAREVQKHILAYHRQVDECVYDLDADAFDFAVKVLGDDRTQWRRLSTCDFGRPAYRITEEGNTERLWAPGWSDLIKCARYAIVPEWVELDLRAAYFGILARVASLNNLATPTAHMIALLAAPGDTWANVCEAAGVSREHRSKVKTAFLAAAFGAGTATLKNKLGDISDAVLTSALMREVQAVHRALAAVAKARGWIRGMKGRVQAKGRSFGATLHHVCSEFELCLIDACYVVADRTPGSVVALYQYDGVAVTGEDLEPFIVECQQAVAERALHLGVCTRLEVKRHRMPEAKTLKWAAAQPELWLPFSDLEDAA